MKELQILRNEFTRLQASLRSHEAEASKHGGQSQPGPDPETTKTLQCVSDEYDDLMADLAFNRPRWLERPRVVSLRKIGPPDDLKTNFDGRGVGGYRPLVYTSGLECLRRKLVLRQSRNVWVKVRHWGHQIRIPFKTLFYDPDLFRFAFR